MYQRNRKALSYIYSMGFYQPFFLNNFSTQTLSTFKEYIPIPTITIQQLYISLLLLQH